MKDLIYATCAQCGTQFDAVRAGKVRRAETFCSIECADKAHPDMAQTCCDRNERNLFGQCIHCWRGPR